VALGGAREAAHEHACLLRHLGTLQARVSEQMSALVAAEASARARAGAAERECRALQAALLRERARWVQSCTCWFWGLGASAPPGLARPSPRAEPGEIPSPVTSAEVLCQTACQGHAHPWLQADGACRLSAGECTRMPAQARVGDPHGPAD
jgi:hypothetical protein